MQNLKIYFRSWRESTDWKKTNFRIRYKKNSNGNRKSKIKLLSQKIKLNMINFNQNWSEMNTS